METLELSFLKPLRRYDEHLERDGFTYDRDLDRHGIADLDDPGGRIRTLALARLIAYLQSLPGETAHLPKDADPRIRRLTMEAVGITGIRQAREELERLLVEEARDVNRSQAAVDLGQIGLAPSLEVLRRAEEADPSRDVRHQCALAAYQIERRIHVSPELPALYSVLSAGHFQKPKVGTRAPGFALQDVDGRPWSPDTLGDGRWTVLIWVFADWCPVCHGEFRELIAHKNEFLSGGVRVATVECHDRFRCRVMAGRELEPDYWFSDKPFKEAYTQNIWWPHLCDKAGVVAARYGVSPRTFLVHAEWINRPAVFILDSNQHIRFAYYGTFWGDRPSIPDILNMIRRRDFSFRHPDRLSLDHS